MNRFYLTLVVILMSCNILNAQWVSGKVTSYNYDTPAAGAAVMIKRTNKGCITDVNGNYRIKVDSLPATLVFSFTGYRSQEIKIEKDSIINVILEEDDVILEELTITAYIKRSKPKIGIKQDTIKVNKFRILKKNRYVIHRYTYVGDVEETQILKIEKQWFDTKNNSFFKYIYDNIDYPDLTVRYGIESGVSVRFKMDLEGNVVDAEIIRGSDNLINKKVLSVIQSAPQLTQGEINRITFGKPKYYIGTFILPIRFIIDENE